MYRCYLFDFDYTLVDSTEGIVGCFQRTLQELARPPLPADAIARTIGLPMPEAVGRLLKTTRALRSSSAVISPMPIGT